MKVTAVYDSPTSATLTIAGLPAGWAGSDLSAGFTSALEALLAEARGLPAPADALPEVEVDVRVLPPSQAPSQAPSEPSQRPSGVTAEPSTRPAVGQHAVGSEHSAIPDARSGPLAQEVYGVTDVVVDGVHEEPLGAAVLAVGVGPDAAPCGCPEAAPAPAVEPGPDLRVGTALARLGLRSVEDVSPVDVADAAFPDDVHLNMAVVKLLRLAESRMLYAAVGERVPVRTDLHRLWDLDKSLARARRAAWARVGAEEKTCE